MKKIIHKHRTLWQQKGFAWSVALGLIFLGLSSFLNYKAGVYAFARFSNGVRDLILDNIPRFDVSLVFIEGAILVVVFTTIVTLYEPKYIPFTLKSTALLYLFRSLAITLTHLGPPLSITNPVLGSSVTERFVYGTDYFFSGHTALPFLLALIFWQNVYLRYLFIIITISFAASALLGHLHYSIDVFAALFISHSSYIIAARLFPKDIELTKS